mgnify:CR=1 FL=1
MLILLFFTLICVKTLILFSAALLVNKLLTKREAKNVVRVLPPLNVKKSEINLSLKIIKKVCSELN